jgi:hypothetical protein
MMYLLEAIEWTQCEQQKSHVSFILSLSQVTVSVRMTRSSDQVKAVNEQALEQQVLSRNEPRRDSDFKATDNEASLIVQTHEYLV